jgi:hypothetical protein
MMKLSRPHHRQETAMFSMSQALDRIKGDTTHFLDAPRIRAACREAGLTFRNAAGQTHYELIDTQGVVETAPESENNGL